MILGKSSRVEGVFERLGFLEKVHGGKKFDDVAGILTQNDKIEELLKDIERRGIIEPRKLSAQEQRSLRKHRGEPVNSQATIVEITIV